MAQGAHWSVGRASGPTEDGILVCTDHTVTDPESVFQALDH